MTTTRQLFICETTTTATGSGVREVWEPSDAELAEMGLIRIVRVDEALDAIGFPPAGHTTSGAPVYTVASPAPPEPANGHGVVRPCPVHGVRPFSLCSNCRAWAEREATR